MVVTEIMYEPYDFGFSEDRNNSFEWIELQNKSTNPISLSDVRFNDGIEFTFPGLTLEAGERTIVTGSIEGFEKFMERIEILR